MCCGQNECVERTFRGASGLIEFQYERPVCVLKNSIGISTVAVQVLLQKKDLRNATSLTGELFPSTDDVMSRDTHSVLVHLVAEAWRRI